MLTIKEININRRVRKEYLDGLRTMNLISHPVIYKHENKYYMAVFVAYYYDNDVENNTICQPMMAVLMDLLTGDFAKHQIPAFYGQDFTTKYTLGEMIKHEKWKSYNENAYEILDQVRMIYEETGEVCEELYDIYMETIFKNVPDDYKKFYRKLSNCFG